MKAHLLYSFLASSTASKNSGIPSPVIADTPTACSEVISSTPPAKAPPTYPQVLVKLVEHQAHAVHQAVHVPWTVVASRIPAVEQGRLERLKIAHPLDRKVVWLDIGLVEDEDEGEAGLVEDTEDA